MAEHGELIDFGDYPEIFADGVAEVFVVGPNVRLVLFAWRRIAGCFQRVVVATVIRPRETFSEELMEKCAKITTHSPTLVHH